MKVTKNLYIYLLFSILSIAQCSYAAATGQITSLTESQWSQIQAIIKADDAKNLATYLTENNISPNARRPHSSNKGQTLLINAAFYDKPAIAQYLLENGADKELTDWQKNTAQAWARSRGSAKVSHLLNPPVVAEKVDEVVLPNVRINNDGSRDRLVQLMRRSSDNPDRLAPLYTPIYMSVDELLAAKNVYIVKGE